MTPAPGSFALPLAAPPIIGCRIVVWFSCGVASAVAAKLAVDRYGRWNRVRIVNHPVAEEDPDNRRFADATARWIGAEIETSVNPKYPEASAVSVWNRRKAMVFPHGAPCTVHLKKEAGQHFVRENPIDWHVFGFSFDERKRHDRFVLTERSNVLPILIEAGLTKQACFEMVLAAGIEPPKVYAEGYPNANCIGCVKATSPTYWNHVRRTRPEIFAERAEQSRRLGARLVEVKGEKIFLDELDPFAIGRPMKSMRFECGVFCEEYRENEE